MVELEFIANINTKFLYIHVCLSECIFTYRSVGLLYSGSFLIVIRQFVSLLLDLM